MRDTRSRFIARLALPVLLFAALVQSHAKPARPAPSAPAVSGATAGRPPPRTFDLLEGEAASFGFVVDRAGVFAVRVQSQGAPIVVSLRKPDGSLVERSGAALTELSVPVTPADVARGPFWAVTVRDPALRPGAPARHVARALARGSVSVQQPPADPRYVDTLLGARAAQQQGRLARLPGIGDRSAQALVALAARRQASYDQAAGMRRAATLAQARALMSPQAFARGQQELANPQMAVRTRGGATAAAPLPPGRGALRADAMRVSSLTVNNGPASSLPEGQPHDVLWIRGTGFGAVPGVVHIAIDAGWPFPAPIISWSDTQVLAYVPTIYGVPPYDGWIQLLAPDGRESARLRFGFRPATEVKVVPVHDESAGVFAQPYLALGGGSRFFGVQHSLRYDGLCLCGAKGDDTFFAHGETLLNGWVVDDAVVVDAQNYDAEPIVYSSLWSGPNLPPGQGIGRLEVTEVHPGGASKLVRVHWWLGLVEWVDYNVVLVIHGPKNLPFE